MPKKIIDYHCGSCGLKFRMEWHKETVAADCDLSTCPCDFCGAQAKEIENKSK